MASIRKKRNSYEIRVSCGYDLKGKQKFQQMTWKPEEGMTPKQIEKEVNRQAVLFEEKCLKGQVTANVKFEEFAEQWFQEYAKLNLKNTSYEKMKQLPTRVYPAIGHLRIDRITGRHIQQFVNDLALNGKNQKNGNPLSRKTVVHHLNFISDVFSYAVKMDMLTDNPCRNVTVPKGEAKEKNIYTVEELAQIFELLDSEDVPVKYRVFFKLAVYSGFRRGELLGLEWKDINWEHNLISVRRTSNYTVEQGTYTDTTKTKKSKRTLRFPDHVMDMLRELKEEQDRERIKLSDIWADTDRLFTQADGRPMNNNTPYYWIKRFCERNNLRFCDIHSLRHAHASILINAGVDVATVSADLGHSTPTTTLGKYTHEFQEAQAKTSHIIENALCFSQKKEPVTV
ncbi:MAG: site-specific integrase [Oscillospiraceae bacterium]|nr:site-specific integrase [Oscillospiraceae bacterium]